MHTMIETRTPTAADVEYVAAHMREADKLECLELFELEPKPALEQSIRHSSWCVAVISRGDLIAIVGVARLHLLSTTGEPWMLGVEGIEAHPRAFAVMTGPLIAKMASEYPRLENVVHSENETSIAWLRRAGFEFGEAERFGRRGAWALRFWKASDAVRDCGPGEFGAVSVRPILIGPSERRGREV